MNKSQIRILYRPNCRLLNVDKPYIIRFSEKKYNLEGFIKERNDRFHRDLFNEFFITLLIL